MVNIPKSKQFHIDEGEGQQSEHRPHLGYSELGKTCSRELWYKLHWVSTFTISPRLKRIFETGHRAEEFMIETLEEVGIKVSSEQDEVSGYKGHIMGHIDGLCKGVDGKTKTLLLEMKTANQKSFTAMLNKGVRLSKPVYYAQMQSYMGKLKLKHSLFMMYNKNTSDYYFEIVEFNKGYHQDLERKAEQIVEAEILPEKIGSASWFECKFCNFAEVCHEGIKPDPNCRTCQYVKKHDKGVWYCDLKSKQLSLKKQHKGCKDYSINQLLGDTK